MTATTRRRGLSRWLNRHPERTGPKPADSMLLEHDGVHSAPAETFRAAPDITFAGSWDTGQNRKDAAAIFGPRPHGIATPDTLAEIQAMAAEQAAIDGSERRRIALEERDRTTSDLRPARPYAEPAPSDDPTLVFRAAPWMPPVSGAESARRMATLIYPKPRGTVEQPGGSREQYAAMARQVSAYTNTRSPKEQPSGWEPMFRTAGPDEPLRPWDLRPAVLALTAGSEAA